MGERVNKIRKYSLLIREITIIRIRFGYPILNFMVSFHVLSKYKFLFKQLHCFINNKKLEL